MKNSLLDRIVFICWIVFASIVFFSSFKEQIIVNKNVQKQIGTVFPEGWGFFTKNPRDLFLDVYIINNDEIQLLPMSTHSKNSKLGFSRTPRIIGYEASMVANEIPADIWKEGKSIDILSYINDSSFVLNKKEHFRYLNKGNYLFKVHRKVPYAWAKKNQEKYNPFTIAKVTIK